MKANWSCGAVISEACVVVGSFGVASRRLEKIREAFSDYGLDGWERGADDAGVDFDIGPDSWSVVVI